MGFYSGFKGLTAFFFEDIKILRPVCSLRPAQATSSVVIEWNTKVWKTKTVAVLKNQVFLTGKYFV